MGKIDKNFCILYSILLQIHTFRDSLIDYLYQENVRQRQEVNHLLMDHQQIVADFRNRVLELESTLSTKVSALLGIFNNSTLFCELMLYKCFRVMKS